MRDSRFNYLERPIMHPGHCVSCKSSGPVVDFGANVPMLGRLYVCEECVRGAYSNLPPTEEEKLNSHRKELFDQATEVIKVQNDILGSISNSLDKRLSLGDSALGDFDFPDNSDEPGTKSEDDDSSGEKPEPPGKQGAARVPSNPLDDLL